MAINYTVYRDLEKQFSTQGEVDQETREALAFATLKALIFDKAIDKSSVGGLDLIELLKVILDKDREKHKLGTTLLSKVLKKKHPVLLIQLASFTRKGAEKCKCGHGIGRHANESRHCSDIDYSGKVCNCEKFELKGEK